MKQIEVAIIGTGGVGGYFGGRLCEVQERAGAKVHFIARGEHLKAIQKGGLLLKVRGESEIICRPASASDQIRTMPTPDVCLVCVKEFDLRRVLEELREVIHGETVIIPLFNGMDIYERVRRVIKSGVVLPACVYIGTHIEAPGVISQSGGARKILFGPDPMRPGFVPTGMTELFKAAKIESEWLPSVEAEIWGKFIFISAFGLVTAAHAKTVGEVLESESLKGDLVEVIKEVVALAEGLRIDLPSNIVERSIEKGRGFPYETKTSFQRDFEKRDKPDERALFGEAILEQAGRVGLEAPKTKELQGLLNEKKPAFWQAR